MLNNNELILFFLQIAVMLGAGIIISFLMKKIDIPDITGELLAGIILGPTILGHVNLNILNKFSITSELNCFLQFGMVLFMFVSGLKISKSMMLKKKKAILFSSLFGIILSFVLGVALTLNIPLLQDIPDGNNKTIYVLFIGIALSISALPVIIKILNDLNMTESEEGSVIIGAAALGDIIGWTMFACLINAFLTEATMYSVLVSVIKFFLFLLFLVTIGVWICKSCIRLIDKGNKVIHINIIILMLTLLAGLAEIVGIHPFFAAFILGISLKEDFNDRPSLQETKLILNTIAGKFFAPLYFISIGMKTDFIKNFNFAMVVIILFIAFAGKIAGSGLGAMTGGLKLKSALIVGVGLNARGAIEIIIATTALDLNIIGQQIYVSFIIMAVLTSLVSGLVIKKLQS